MVLGLNETMDQLAMANSVSWSGHMLRMEHEHLSWRLKVKGGRKWPGVSIF